MLTDSQRFVLGSIELPAPLRAMINENVVDERLPEYYHGAIPTREQLTEPVTELRDRARCDFETVAQQTDLVHRQAMLNDITGVFDYKLTMLSYPLVIMTAPFMKTDVFLQLTTALSERQQILWRARVANDKATTDDFINTLLADLRSDIDASVHRIKTQMRREQRRRKLKCLFRPAV